MTMLGFHTSPPGRESLGRTLPQGFTLGYFRLFPPGRTALNASLFPHLELLISNTHEVRHNAYVLLYEYVLLHSLDRSQPAQIQRALHGILRIQPEIVRGRPQP